MADPICRWRNTTPETVQLLVRLLPKREMPESEFKKCLKENCDAENFDYDGFLTTAYQLAVQIGLYFISDDGVYHPRFDHNLTEAEAKEYVARVATLYVSPNPYAKSMSAAKSVVCLYDFFVQRAGQLGIGSNIDVKAELANLYQLPMGNTDMIVNLLSRTGAFLKIDGQHVKYIGRASVADNKESYFKHFGGLLDSGSVQHPMNEETGLLRVGDHFIGKDGGAFTVLECLPRIYRIRVVETGKTRSVPKTVVSAWYEFYKTHPTIDYELKKSNGTIEHKTNVPIRDAATRPIRDLINETTIDDKYEHGYDGMLGTITRWLLDHPERKDAPESEPHKALLAAAEPRKVDRLTIALKLFAAKRDTSPVLDEEKKASDGDLCGEFSDWAKKTKGRQEKSTDAAVRYLRSLTDSLKPPDTTIWHGLREALYGSPAGKDVFHVASLAEFDDLFGRIAQVFEKESNPDGLDEERYKQCRDWFEKATSIYLPGVYKLYREFLEWRDGNGRMSYDAWARAAREAFAKADAAMFAAKDFDYVGFTHMFVYNPTVMKAGFAEHADDDKKAVGDFLSQNRQQPLAASWYLDQNNLPKVDGLDVGVALDLMMKVRPNEFVSYSPMIDKALGVVGLLQKPMPNVPTIESYEASRSLQGRVLAKMHELKIGKAADDESSADYLTVNEFAWWLSDEKNQNLIKEKVMAAAYKKTEIKRVTQTEIKDFSDFIKKLEEDVASAGLKYADGLMKRFVCAQLAKPFVVLTGLSGSGKTKLAEAFTKWIGVENTVNIVPVGADWTNNEKLLGYPNALDSEKYVMPDTGVLKLMLDANENPDLPFFLILDEMNLSHVERYFADFLSTMESNDGIIELYDSGKRYAEDGREIPPSFPFPKNLFVIGTMNVDETTYMFSPKVLDRAQVIEFRVSEKEMSAFLAAPGNPKIDELAGKGAAYAKAFLDLAKERKTKDIGADEKKKFNELLIGKVDPKTKELDGLFTALAKLGAEFGYRSAIEMVIFIAYYLEASAYGKLTQSVDREKFLKDAIDAAVLQKLLPKLHGSLNRLGPVIDALISKVTITQTDQNGDSDTTLIYPLTCEKLLRMKDRVEKNGFTSFAEA